MNPIPGQANTVFWNAVKRADGSPITTGTVNYYLQAVTGANAGKWWFGADAPPAWNAAEQIAGAMTFVGGSEWKLSLAAAIWIDGVEYRGYGKESTDLHIPHGDSFRAVSLPNTVAPDNANIVNIHNIVKATGPGDLAAVKTKVDLNLDAKVSEIQAAIVAATTIDRAADSVTLTTGSLVAGTVVSTHTKNAIYYVTAPVTPAVGGFGLNQFFEFMLADAEIAAKVHIWARFVNSPPPTTRVVRIAAYDWVGTAWEFISTGATDLAHSTSDEERLLELLVRHRSEAGLVRIAFTSDSTATTDRLYIDQCTVHVSMSGPTKSEIAIAVADRVLIVPANKLATDAAGKVTANNAELANLDAPLSEVKIVTDKLDSMIEQVP